jgi:hypothetical protein
MKDYKKKNIIDYMVMCISEFADRNNVSGKQAFNFLSNFGGIGFLTENYEIEHTLALEDVIDDLSIICKKNGGVIT